MVFLPQFVGFGHLDEYSNSMSRAHVGQGFCLDLLDGRGVQNLHDVRAACESVYQVQLFLGAFFVGQKAVEREAVFGDVAVLQQADGAGVGACVHGDVGGDCDVVIISPKGNTCQHPKGKFLQNLRKAGESGFNRTKKTASGAVDWCLWRSGWRQANAPRIRW